MTNERGKAPPRHGLIFAFQLIDKKLIQCSFVAPPERDLHSDDAFRARLDAQFTGNYSIRFHLAPPLLSRANPTTGKVKKYEFGPWLLPVFHVLAKLKWLRGTPWDIFALTSERRQEREDLARYQADLAEVCDRLTPGNYQVARQLMRLPEQLRGYGHVKAGNREKLLLARSKLLSEFRGYKQTVEVIHQGAA